MNKEKSNKYVQKSVHVPEEAPKVSTSLVVRTIVYIVAIINGVAAFLGYDLGLEVNQEFVYELVSLIFMGGAFIDAYWRNNDLTKKARIKSEAAKQVEKNIKKGKK